MKASRVLRRAGPFLLAFLSGTLSVTASSPEKKAHPVVIADVVVTDDANQPVKGLREEDFQLFENGKRQKLQSFQEYSAPAKPAGEPRPAKLPPNTFTNAAASAPDSINVILLDQLNTSLADQQIGLDAVISFISHKPARAAFAIFILRNDDPACAPYTSSRLQAIQGPTSTSEWRCTTLGRLMLIEGITVDKDRLLAGLNSHLASPHPTGLRMSLDPWTLGMSSNSALYNLYLLRGAPPLLPTYAFTSYGRDFYPSTPPEVYDSGSTWIAEIGNFLQDLPGRKSLIWISDSFDAQPIAQYFDYWFPPRFKGWEQVDPLSPTLMTHLAADRLDLARVALYLADLTGKTGGIEVKRLCPNYLDGDDLGLPSTISSQFQSPVPPGSDNGTCTSHYFKLSYVAAQTGGKAFHGAQKVQDAIAHAISDESNYYSLAYSSGGAKLNGKVREVKVALNRKNYHLAYRRHYFADDPGAVNRPAIEASPDIFIRTHKGPLPWQVIRIHNETDGANDPLLRLTRWGAPETNDITFSAHVEAVGPLQKATPEQMEQLQDFDSFRRERIQEELENPTRVELKMLNKGKGVLNSLPPADPVSVGPYSIDYSLPGNQITLKPGQNGQQTYDLEVAVLVYDALGKTVAGAKQLLVAPLGPSEVEHVRNSDLHVHQELQVPDRASVLRFVFHDVFGNRFGSLEVPVSAISSPYKRQELEPAPQLEQTNRRQPHQQRANP